MLVDFDAKSFAIMFMHSLFIYSIHGLSLSDVFKVIRSSALVVFSVALYLEEIIIF